MLLPLKDMQTWDLLDTDRGFSLGLRYNTPRDRCKIHRSSCKKYAPFRIATYHKYYECLLSRRLTRGWSIAEGRNRTDHIRPVRASGEKTSDGTTLSMVCAYPMNSPIVDPSQSGTWGVTKCHTAL
jgi:hypothetical protein